MNRSLTILLLLTATGLSPRWAAAQSQQTERVPTSLRTYCHRCHGPKDPKAGFRLDNLSAPRAGTAELEQWEKILEMVSIGDMPPSDEPQPSTAEKAELVTWLEGRLKSLGRGPDEQELAFPKYANRIDHEALFSGEHAGPSWTRPRVRRLSPYVYEELLQGLDLAEFTVPLTEMQGDGFRDYDVLYADEATIGTMLQNAQRVATTMVHGRLIKPRGRAARDPTQKAYRRTSRHRVLTQFANAEGQPSPDEMRAVIRYAFSRLLNRDPSNDEVQRYANGCLQPNVEAGGRDAGLRSLLVTLLLSPEFLFRMELGLGGALPDGRRMLSPHELAYALSYALYDHPVDSLIKAAGEGRLVTREDVGREVRAILASHRAFRGKVAAGNRKNRFWTVGKGGMDSVDKPQLLRFFREFFGYTKALDIFKDEVRHAGAHKPKQIVEEADWFVLRVLADDRHVLKELLTSREFFVAYRRSRNVSSPAVYNLPKDTWSKDSPVTMPGGQRAGLLTHPAWLVAHSGNFENDPVRRGKWIQEKLLAGVVPDIPIGVEAQLPDEPRHTLRQRFHVVRNDECWRCHRKMNPLGTPFEMFDDFGRHRDNHHVTKDGLVLASDLEMNRYDRDLQAEPTIPVDTSGVLTGTGDEELDGNVRNAIDLVERLAASTRVRQSFVRHVFRFWMGRNETLDDSPTLMAMDRAYVESEGSMQATLIALLTSDSFLCRK